MSISAHEEAAARHLGLKNTPAFCVSSQTSAKDLPFLVKGPSGMHFNALRLISASRQASVSFTIGVGRGGVIGSWIGQPTKQKTKTNKENNLRILICCVIAMEKNE